MEGCNRWCWFAEDTSVDGGASGGLGGGIPQELSEVWMPLEEMGHKQCCLQLRKEMLGGG